MSLLLKPTIIPSDSWNYILESVDQLSQSYASKTTALEKRSLGQVFTSLPMARQLISLISDFNNKNNSYADLGTGTGILSASLIARHSSECPQPPTSLLAFEKDTKLHSQWVKSFSDIAKKIGMNDDDCKLECDFYQQAESILTTGKPQSGESVSRLVSNPPYIKLGSKTHLSLLLKEHGIHAPNHYAAFVALSVVWLENEGDLLAILPRSFFSGIYFKKFRDWLSSKMSIEHIVAYSSRSNFKNVLQESVCIYLKKTKQRDVIRVSYCEHAEAEPTHDLLIPKSQILGDIWYLPSTPMQLDALKNNRKLKHTLDSLGLSVRTGVIEIHRAQHPDAKPVKVLYSRDFDANGTITWAETKKPRYFASSRSYTRLLDDGSGYVVIKRITANDGDKDRLMPTWVSKESTGLSLIGFDNHLQIFSFNGQPLPKSIGMKLIAFLQCKNTNLCMSLISGTTQINVSDLQALKYPDLSKYNEKTP